MEKFITYCKNQFAIMDGKLKFDKYLILLWIICGIALFFFVGHYVNILIDFGREVYYPERILEGKVLYKDLFNIYGPFSYQFNAGLYKLFGIKLSSLYFSGCISSLLIVSGIYLIAKRFLSKFLSFTISILTISIGVVTPIIHNFSFPYSWAMLYGLVCFLYSLFFILKYKTEKKPVHLYLSTFLAGVCFANKYEFIVYSFLIFLLIIQIGIKDWKIGLKAFIAFISVPIISFGILFLQGLKISELINSFKLVHDMAESKTLKYFYQNMGVYYHPKTIPFMIAQFIKTVIAYGSLILGVFLFNKNKIVSAIVLSLSVILCIVLTISTQRLTLLFLPVLLLIFTILSFKKLKNNMSLAILVLSAIAVSLKSFWGLIILSYGTYYTSILIIAFLALFFQYIPKKYEKITGIYILILSLYFAFINIAPYNKLTYSIQTPKGTINTYKELENPTAELIMFLKQNTKPKDKVVIFPEGMTINFLADRKGDDFYNSLLPLYVEVFGEDKVIEHFSKTKPEYVIFTDENLKDGGFNNICNDYAQEFCAYVSINYNYINIISSGRKFLIFRKK